LDWQWHFDGTCVKIKKPGFGNCFDAPDETRTAECSKALLNGYKQRKNWYKQPDAVKTKNR